MSRQSGGGYSTAIGTSAGARQGYGRDIIGRQVRVPRRKIKISTFCFKFLIHCFCSVFLFEVSCILFSYDCTRFTKVRLGPLFSSIAINITWTSPCQESGQIRQMKLIFHLLLYIWFIVTTTVVIQQKILISRLLEFSEVQRTGAIWCGKYQNATYCPNPTE